MKKTAAAIILVAIASAGIYQWNRAGSAPPPIPMAPVTENEPKQTEVIAASSSPPQPNAQFNTSDSQSQSSQPKEKSELAAKEETTPSDSDPTSESEPEIQALRSTDIPETNGLHYLLAAAELLTDDQAAMILLKWNEMGADAWTDPEIQALIAQSQEIFDLIRMALEVGDIIFPFLENGPNEPIPWVRKWHSLGFLFAMEGRAFSDEGDFTNALQRLMLSADFANESNNGGTIIGGLVGYVVSDVALQELLRVLDQTPLHPTDYEFLIDKLNQIDARIHSAGELQYYELEGMAAWVNQELEQGNTLREIFDDLPTPMQLENFTDSQIETFYVQYLQDLEAVTDFFHLPYYETAQYGANIFDTTNPISAYLLPDPNRIALATAQNRAQVRGTLTTVAIHAFAADNAAYPPNLDALVPRYLPQIPIDPFTGQSLIYQFTPGGDYTLQSAGADIRGNDLIFR